MDLLTKGSVPGVLSLDVPEEVPLSGVQGAPFFSRKIERDVSQCHRLLEWGDRTQLRSPRQLCERGQGGSDYSQQHQGLWENKGLLTHINCRGKAYVQRSLFKNRELG